MSADKKTRILYIAGTGRSGSTLLGLLLGELPGFANCGELALLWERGLRLNRRCGCGEHFLDCGHWRRVLARAGIAADSPAARNMTDLDRRLYRPRAWPLLRSNRGRARLGLDEGYLDTLRALYAAIRVETGCDVIVDSSKSPGYGFVLSLVPEFDVHVLHLVRDPRAVAFSWQRRKQYEPGSHQLMDRFGALHIALLWLFNNAAAARLARDAKYRFLRYEDYVRDPRGAVAGILASIRESGARRGDRGAEPPCAEAKQHTVAGNPARFERRTGALRIDDEWERQASWGTKMIVKIICGPLMRRYGYR